LQSAIIFEAPFCRVVRPHIPKMLLKSITISRAIWAMFVRITLPRQPPKRCFKDELCSLYVVRTRPCSAQSYSKHLIVVCLGQTTRKYKTNRSRYFDPFVHCLTVQITVPRKPPRCFKDKRCSFSGFRRRPCSSQSYSKHLIVVWLGQTFRKFS